MKVFEFIDYKAFLRAKIAKADGHRGYQSELARIAGCQKSFLSQVLRSDVHLTRDHVAELARFWDLDERETEYFLSLLDLERAGSKALRAHLGKRVRSLRNERTKLVDSLPKSKVMPAEAQATYYSSWYWSAIHIALSVPETDTPAALAQRLNLPAATIMAALTKLEHLGLATETGGRWSAQALDVHLPEDSFMSEMNHTHWRSRAIHDVQKRDANSLHYTSVFAVSRTDARKIHALLRASVLEGRKVIPLSEAEDMYCLNADFFRV